MKDYFRDKSVPPVGELKKLWRSWGDNYRAMSLTTEFQWQQHELVSLPTRNFGR